VATIPASGEVQQVGSVARVNVNTGTILVNTGATMARVGFTGAYGDLSGRPTLGTAAAQNVGVGAGNVVQLDNAAKLPAVDGSQLTNLPAAAATDLSYDASTRLLSSSTGTDVTLPLVSTTAAGLAKETGTPSGRFFRDDGDWAHPQDVIVIPVGDETTPLTTGTSKVRFRMPFAATLLAVRANVNTAPTGSTLIVDVNEAGTSLLGTKLSIDASETTSTTAASAATITDSGLADDAEISIDIDQIGSTIAGAGLKVSLFVRRA
jgi:hypothetical protein